MNTKIAKVIAFELGILIAILTWMAFSGMPGEKPAITQELQDTSGSSFATLSPVLKPKKLHLRALDYSLEADAAPEEEVEPTQAVQAYQPVQTVQAYDQQYATEPYATTVEDYPVVQDPASYIGTYPEPVLPPDYYYSPYGNFFIYSQPAQIIIVSNRQRSGHRHHMAPRSGGPHVTTPMARPDRGVPHRQPGPAPIRPGMITPGRGVIPPTIGAGPGGPGARPTLNTSGQSPQANRTRWRR